jgi:HPt (histidine-containing phosphotransfer) domain-containing protein
MNYKFINTEYIDSVASGDNEIIREIVVMFKEQVVEFHNEMADLYARKEYHLLGLLAHKAKSSVAVMGMGDLAVTLKQFELQAREGRDIDKYESYIEKFRHETTEAVRELEDLVQSRLK